MIMLGPGSDGPAVRRIQEALARNGYSVGPLDGEFGPMTLAALIQFQQTHLGPDGRALGVDGIVGTATLWALEHASGSAQEETLLIPASDVEGLRGKLIAVAKNEIGVCEEPDGSNGGPRVDVYTDRWRVSWCALGVSWCLRQVREKAFPPHRALASAVKIRNWGLDRRAWRNAETYTPRAGDIFVQIKHGFDGVDTGHGHVGLVVAWDGESITTVEFNCANAVRSRRRHGKTIAGYVMPEYTYER